MRKVTVICLAGDRDRALHALRELGVLHLAPVSRPEGADIDRSRRELAEAEAAAFILGRETTVDATPAGAAAAPAADPEAGPATVGEVQRLVARRKELSDRLEALQAEKAAVEPFGDFDPNLLKALQAKGVAVRLFCVPGKDAPSAPEGAGLAVLGQDAAGRYVAIFKQGSFEFAGKEFPIPERSLSAVAGEIGRARRELDGIGVRLRQLNASLPAVRSHAASLREKVEYLEALESMGSGRNVAYVQGFCPEGRVAAIQAAAPEHGWGLVVEAPAAADPVPTAIKNPAWLRPIESLFGFIKILPGYREVDVSASFLFFFSLFFAMIVGDAGYGLFFLGATLLLRRRFKTAPAEPFRLMMIFSVCTIVWGALCGAYFGVTDIPGPLARFRIDWLSDSQNMMHLCLLIGAIHLTVAHVWVMIRVINSTRAIAQAGWTAVVWTVFFGARALLLGMPFPGWYVPIAGAGLLAVILFLVPLKELRTGWINLAMLPLTLMSNFGDILSYLRLFALSVASLKLASAFNDMAMTVGFDDLVRGFGAALILFIGHALNIVLGCLSVLVHGVRLNALEFSTHFGLEWAGIPYRPFSRHRGA